MVHVFNHFVVSFGLFSWHKRVNVCKLCPCEWYHFHCSVQFHGTRTQWYHCTIQREVFDFQFLQISHHLGLRVVSIEDSLSQESRLSLQRCRNWVCLLATYFSKCFSCRVCQHVQDSSDLFTTCCFVGWNSYCFVVNQQEVHLIVASLLAYFFCIDRTFQTYGIEICFVELLISVSLCTFCNGCCGVVYVLCNFSYAFLSVPCCILSCHYGNQCLSGTDVGSCFLAFDVLFSCLES